MSDVEDEFVYQNDLIDDYWEGLSRYRKHHPDDEDYVYDDDLNVICVRLYNISLHNRKGNVMKKIKSICDTVEDFYNAIIACNKFYQDVGYLITSNYRYNEYCLNDLIDFYIKHDVRNYDIIKGIDYLNKIIDDIVKEYPNVDFEDNSRVEEFGNFPKDYEDHILSIIQEIKEPDV